MVICTGRTTKKLYANAHAQRTRARVRHCVRVGLGGFWNVAHAWEGARYAIRNAHCIMNDVIHASARAQLVRPSLLCEGTRSQLSSCCFVIYVSI